MKFVIVKTRSNYRNLNGRILKVLNETLNYVDCEVITESGKKITASFTKNEIVQID